MGEQVIFEPDLMTYMRMWAARGELAIGSYAKKRSMLGASTGRMFSVITRDNHAYMLPIQLCLKEHGYYAEKVDGQFGSRMVSAIAASITKGDSQSGSSQELPYVVHEMGYPKPAYIKYLKSKHPDYSLN